MNDLSKACLDEAKNSMKSSISFLEKELTKIRAGKANPGMLDGVKVDYYGTMTEISQVANINTPDARSIVIQPWEKTLVGAINKAILDANLGFTPRHEGDILRITEGSLAVVPCVEQDPIECKRSADCAVLPMWRGLYKVINEYLDSVTLQDILDQQKERSVNDYVI